MPTLEAFPHAPLPRGDFTGWCGLNEQIFSRDNLKTEIYNGEIKASPLSFPHKSTLACDDDGRKMAFIDEEAGLVSEVDIPGGNVMHTLASFNKDIIQEISFSPDLKNVASREPLTLTSSAVNLNVIPLSGSGRRAIALVRWNRDSSELFGISAPEGKANHGFVEVVDIHHRRIGSGALPAGFLFRDGWFANKKLLYLYLAPSRDEFGSGAIFRCKIDIWKCDQIAHNVLEASMGGDGILGLVRAVGEYSNDGETEVYPPRYVVEIRNIASQVVARQMFKSTERTGFRLVIAPSGTKAVLAWHGFDSAGCPPEKQESDVCRNGTSDGIIVDLSGRSE